ncbi:MAG: hypothetical protein ACKO85_10090, partial [Isosphaeraceae bacterium]
GKAEDGMRVHSFQTLLKDLGTLSKNRVQMSETPAEFEMLKKATSTQQKAFELLGIKPTT